MDNSDKIKFTNSLAQATENLTRKTEELRAKRQELDDLDERISINSSNYSNEQLEAEKQKKKAAEEYIVVTERQIKKIERFISASADIKKSGKEFRELNANIKESTNSTDTLIGSISAMGKEAIKTARTSIKIGPDDTSIGFAQKLTETITGIQKAQLGVLGAQSGTNDELQTATNVLQQQMGIYYQLLDSQSAFISGNKTVARGINEITQQAKEANTELSLIGVVPIQNSIDAFKQTSTILSSNVLAGKEMSQTMRNIGYDISKLGEIQSDVFGNTGKESRIIDSIAEATVARGQAMVQFMNAIASGDVKQQEESLKVLKQREANYNSILTTYGSEIRSSEMLSKTVNNLSSEFDNLKGKITEVSNTNPFDRMKDSAISLSNTISDIKMSQSSTKDMGAGLSSISSGSKSITTNAKAGKYDDRQLAFAVKIQDAAEKYAQAQKENFNSAGKTKEEQKETADILIQAEKIWASIIKEMQDGDAKLKQFAGSVNTMNTGFKNVSKEMRIVHGLTEDEVTQLKKLTSAADEFGIKMKAIGSTISLIRKRPLVLLGLGIMAAGKAMSYLTDTVKQMGGYIEGTTLATAGLSVFFKDAVGQAISLSDQFGGIRNVSNATQLNANLLASNLNLSSDETAKLIGGFARLSDGTAESAENLMAGSAELAKVNGLIPSVVMKDLAGSTEQFAMWGGKGGENVLKAAVAAGKLGINMQKVSQATDKLLDFDSSMSDELEAQSMLGRNINLSRARSLAYEGKRGEALKEEITQLGGIDQWNKADYYGKQEILKITGLTAEDYQKAASNLSLINDKGEVMVEHAEASNKQFSQADELLKNMALNAGPKAVEAAGGFMTLLGAAGGIGQAIGGAGTIIGGIGKLFGKGKGAEGTTPTEASIPTTTTTIPQATTNIGEEAKNIMAENAAENLAGKSKIPNVGEEVGNVGKVEKGAEAATSSGGIGGALKNLASGLEAMGTGKVAIGILNLGLIALVFAGAMIAAAYGFNQFANVDWQSMAKGGATLVGLGVIAWGISKIEGDILKGAAAIALLGLAMIPFAYGLSLLKGIDFDTVGAAAEALLVFAAAAVVFTALSEVMLPGIAILALLGIGIAAFGAGLEILGGGIKSVISSLGEMSTQLITLSGIDYTKILGLGASLGVLALSLGGFAITGLLALPALVSVSAGFSVMGVAMLVMGAGLSVLSMGLSSVVNQLSTLAQLGFAGILGLATSIGLLSLSLGGFAVAGLLVLPALVSVSAGLLLMGAALSVMGMGVSVLSTSLSTIVTQISALSQIGFAGIMGLATSIGLLALSLGAFSVTGLLVLPAMVSVSAGLVLVGLALGGVGSGLSILSTGVSAIVTQLSTLSQIGFTDILGLAGSMGMLGLSLGGFAISGLLAIPALFGVGVGVMAMGAAFTVMGAGLSVLSTGLPMVVDQLSALSQISFLPILGLASAIGTLSLAMVAFTAAGLLALPILSGVTAVGSLMGINSNNTTTTNTTKTDNAIPAVMTDVLNEIKGLRGDLNAGKIAVYMDGVKVTTGVNRVVDRTTTNYYSHT